MEAKHAASVVLAGGMLSGLVALAWMDGQRTKTLNHQLITTCSPLVGDGPVVAQATACRRALVDRLTYQLLQHSVQERRLLLPRVEQVLRQLVDADWWLDIAPWLMRSDDAAIIARLIRAAQRHGVRLPTSREAPIVSAPWHF